MLDPAIPPDEAQRLEDLCRLELLDTAPEARFDRITRTAARLFDVPTALITLVDADRQWFKSRQGLQGTSTPRRTSFCGHAVLQEGAFVVTDTRADERFADNPLVTGAPYIRFYAGMPLHGAGGHRVGTLCIADRAPRTFSAKDVAALADLAAWAELELNVDSIEHATAVARERQQRLQSIFDHAGDAIVTVSPLGVIQAFNPAAIRMFGSDRGTGTSVMGWLEPASRAAVAGALRGMVQGDAAGALRLDLQCLRTDGREFAAEVTVTRTHGTGDSGYTLLLRDVSERKKVETMKNEFISTVSHELRTPLTSVRGSLGLVLGGAAGEVPAKARSLLEIATSNCDRLVRLVNDMLDVEKIESGHLRFDLAPQPLLPLVKQAIAATEGFAEGMGVRYRLRPGGEGAQAVVDADRMAQVLVNLLSNAAKFSPAGGGVEIGVEEVPGPPPRVRLVVADRGPGIPAHFRDRIFSRFGQADGSDARRSPGTGLGLAISKAIVERLDGRIAFTDRAGGGTEFVVDLPAVAAAQAPRHADAAVLVCGTLPGQAEARQLVLHVEDDADLVQVVRAMLEGSARTQHAATLAEARTLLAQRSYDLILLDMRLPDGQGSELLGALPPANGATPVVIFSGDEVSSEVAAQVSQALVKSRSGSDELAALLRRIAGAATAPGAERQP